MIDLEKIVAALENCSDPAGKCRDCPYEECERFEKSISEYPDELIREAVELLKAQEPRVLTLDEVMRYIGYSEKIPPKVWEKLPLWTESRNGTGVISGYRDVENLRYLIDMDGIDETYIAYKHWRCWSSRPTDEQREAISWTE